MSPLAFRLLTSGIVVAFLVVTHVALPDAEVRAQRQYQFVIALGYGHLLGAALGPLRAGARSPLAAAFAAASIATAFALYVEGVAAWPGLTFVLLALSVWHFTENDAALARALESGDALGGLPRNARAHRAPVLLAGTLVAAALAVSPNPGLLGDLFSASTLFHLVGWLVFLVVRGVSSVRLVALHAPAARALRAARRIPRRGAGAARRVGVLARALSVLGLAPRRAHGARAPRRAGVNADALYLAALCAAFWVALLGARRGLGERADAARFVVGLALGALFARAVGLLCVPAGLLLAAPWPAPSRARFLGAALPALPLAFGVAKLGCVAAGCCAAAGAEALGFAALGAALPFVRAQHAAALALAGLAAVRLAALPLRPEARGSLCLALGWLALAALRCRPKKGTRCPRRGSATSSRTARSSRRGCGASSAAPATSR